jgi:hypothetical protein
VGSRSEVMTDGKIVHRWHTMKFVHVYCCVCAAL